MTAASRGRPRRGEPRTQYALTDVTTPVSGLFRLGDRTKRLEATKVVVEHDGLEVSYVTPYRLGAEEWRTLLAVSALAGLDGDRFRGRDGEPPLPTLWDRFLAEGVAAERDALRLRTTAYALLREVGLVDTGPNRKALSACLERLSAVMQTLRKGNKVMSGARLLSFAHDEDSGELAIGVSPQMARAILGESKQYVRISLVEVRRLPSAAAVLLHAYLSARVRAGATVAYPIDALVEVVYGSGPVAPAARRKRRLLVREALLSFSDWTTWQIGLGEVRAPGGAKAQMARVHRVDRAALERWEAEARAEALPAPRDEHPEYPEAPEEPEEDSTGEG